MYFTGWITKQTGAGSRGLKGRREACLWLFSFSVLFLFVS